MPTESLAEFVCRVPADYQCEFQQMVDVDWWQVFYIVTAFFAAAAALVLLVAFFARKIDGMR